ncbi:MAG: FxsA family protein [Alphaproteobacteria bacterium]|nr:FxsA family protein [Alphaproteobacteria bacterium]
MILALTLFILPLAEVFVFITVGEEIGAFKTILLCILSALVGGYVVQYQGLSVMTRARKDLSAGYLPAGAIFDGLCLMVAGFLMMIPGFVTDVLGFLLLIPPVRHIIKLYVEKHFALKTAQARTPEGDIIEGTYEHVPEPREPLSDARPHDRR